MSRTLSDKPGNAGVWTTLREDWKTVKIKPSFRREFQDIKDFYLDEAQQKRLEEMGLLRRWFFTAFYLIKILFLRLTPFRRILLVLSMLLILSGNSNNNNTDIIGSLILLFVLLLELKDKLLAANELEQGHLVQRALMPERTPPVPGWDIWLFSRPANEVGGDLIDFMQLSDERYGIALGDVAGKGLGAALFMAKLQATIRAIIPEVISLRELGLKLNRIFYRDTPPNSFASLICIILRSDSKALQILNAGHMPPLVYRRHHIEEMPKGGPALGLLPEVAYEGQAIELQKDQWLLVYSDGVTEARNEEGNFFGEQRLFDFLPTVTGLSAAGIGEALVKEVQNFIGEVRAHDDFSAAVIKRRR